jgi:hypothetical protein
MEDAFRNIPLYSKETIRTACSEKLEKVIRQDAHKGIKLLLRFYGPQGRPGLNIQDEKFKFQMDNFKFEKIESLISKWKRCTYVAFGTFRS